MASAQPVVQPQPQPSSQPQFQLRSVLDNLKSIDACHGKLTEIKEAGGLDSLETIQTSEALTGFESRRSGLICLLKRKASNELKSRGGRYRGQRRLDRLDLNHVRASLVCMVSRLSNPPASFTSINLP
ncbi:hypothetical protein PS2_005234 [Malus domestica]